VQNKMMLVVGSMIAVALLAPTIASASGLSVQELLTMRQVQLVTKIDVSSETPSLNLDNSDTNITEAQSSDSDPFKSKDSNQKVSKLNSSLPISKNRDDKDKTSHLPEADLECGKNNVCEESQKSPEEDGNVKKGGERIQDDESKGETYFELPIDIPFP
jgi:hypothetical protein